MIDVIEEAWKFYGLFKKANKKKRKFKEQRDRLIKHIESHCNGMYTCFGCKYNDSNNVDCGIDTIINEITESKNENE
jgi:hypothetical protein